MNSSWWCSSSSSKTSASSSRSWADRLDHLLALVVGGRLDEVGDLRRVQVRQLAVGEAQPRAGHVADERLHVGPVEEGAVGDQRAQPAAAARGAPARGGCGRRPTTRHHPSMQASSISCAVTRRGGSASTSTSLRPSTSCRQQHLAHAALEAPEAQLLAGQPHGARLQRGDPVGGHEQLAAADPRLQAGDRRVAAVGEAHDQVLDPAQPLARHDPAAGCAAREERCTTERRQRRLRRLRRPGRDQQRGADRAAEVAERRDVHVRRAARR